MELTGGLTVVLAVLVLLAVSAGLLLGWSRLGRLRWASWPARLTLLGLSQLCAVLVVALVVNDQFVFFGSWSELLGSKPTQRQPQLAIGALDARLAPRLLADYRAGKGTLVSLPVPGLRSGVNTGPATVYLPPQYGDPAWANRSYPVVELLSGFPGGPVSWVRDLHVQTQLDSLIDRGQAAPFIAVIPVQNVASPRDTECVNVPGGPQVDSYLTYDVRTALERAFRASTSGSQWTAMGYSTGGYCAEDLSVQHPGMFVAAASLAGYNAPAHDPTTHHLFGKDVRLAEQYTPTWLVQHRPVGALHLLLVATKVDRISLFEARQFVLLAKPPLSLSMLTLPVGGHNFNTFSAELAPSFAWLSRYVAMPLAPIPTVDGQSPRQEPYHQPVPDQHRVRLAA